MSEEREQKNAKDDQFSFWRMAIETWQSSGLSIRQFCKREGLSEPAFYVWRKRLNPVCSAAKQTSKLMAPAAQSMPGMHDFIEIAMSNPSSLFEVVLVSGVRLKFDASTAPASLASVLSVLSELKLC